MTETPRVTTPRQERTIIRRINNPANDLRILRLAAMTSSAELYTQALGALKPVKN